MRFDLTISLGNVISMASFLVAAVVAWRAWSTAKQARTAHLLDLEWRISNLEAWRKEHQIDANARDEIIKRLDKVVDFIERERNQKRPQESD